jgi:hypothetical protein
MQTREEVKRALIVVRTYPTPAKTGVEISCTAAITDDGKWLRLFPIPYRFLPQDQRFRKYQWIDVTTTKSTKDSRPESYKIKPDSIKIISEPLSTKGEWTARKQVIFPLKGHCLCCLEAARAKQGHPTLGFFKPHRIERLIIEADAPTWTDAQLAVLRQGHLFETGKRQELEKIPHKFFYRFFCDHDYCNGHKVSCTDWEIGESWRAWKRDYGDQWESKFRETYEKKMIESSDTHFFVGTLHQHPNRWLIVGLFYPPHSTKGEALFNMYGAAEPG